MNLIGLKRPHVRSFVNMASQIEWNCNNDKNCYPANEMVVSYDELEAQN